MSPRRALLASIACVGVVGSAGLGGIRSASASPATGHDGVHARVMFEGAGSLRAPRDAVGRRDEPLTAEETTARDLERVIRAELGDAITGLDVVDARTGAPLFEVNADEKLNPASNVKMISTATSLELLGPTFRYPTRVLGPLPDDGGVIHGDVYLLGSWDPTLVAGDLDQLAAELAERGVHELDGDVVIGGDDARDGIYHPSVSVTVSGGSAAGDLPIVTAPPGFDVVADVTAKTVASGGRPRLSYKLDSASDSTGRPHLALAVSGTIGKGATTTSVIETGARTLVAANTLRAALRAHGIVVAGDVATAELPDFISAGVANGALPLELARHESAALADIVAHVNKYSINWLADRVVISAAALHDRKAATIASGVDAMYGWLGRHAQVERQDAVLDTGSGLSYKTQLSPHELVRVVRGAGGFAAGGFDATLAQAWTDSLSIGGRDGTLTYRFRAPDVRGRLVGKTGTLSTAIALSGLLEIDPARPLAFSIVTNTATPLEKTAVRKTHEHLVGVICQYLARTQKLDKPATAAEGRSSPAAVVHPAVPQELDDVDDERGPSEPSP